MITIDKINRELRTTTITLDMGSLSVIETLLHDFSLDNKTADNLKDYFQIFLIYNILRNGSVSKHDITALKESLDKE